jgi:hypothetical protein
MTTTARWVMAQRRKRIVISQTLRDRARTDPRRTGIIDTTPTEDQ